MLGSMLEIDRTVSAAVAAPESRCLERLADGERYPEWASLIRSVALDGDRVHVRAELLGVGFEMDCSLSVSGHGAELRRLPYGADDGERFVAKWSVAPGRVELHVRAALDAPGPARLLRGRIERRLADDLLADFVRSL
jgi:hypothetical protein